MWSYIQFPLLLDLKPSWRFISCSMPYKLPNSVFNSLFNLKLELKKVEQISLRIILVFYTIYLEKFVFHLKKLLAFAEMWELESQLLHFQKLNMFISFCANFFEFADHSKHILKWGKYLPSFFCWGSLSLAMFIIFANYFDPKVIGDLVMRLGL